EAARGAEASLGDVERAQRAVDAALSAARTDAARQEYAELQEELRQTHRAMTEIARSSFTPPTPGLSELIAVARGAAVSLDDLAAGGRAVNAAFAAATTAEARQQYARLASEVAETRAAMLSAATAAPTLEVQLEGAVRAAYAAGASIADLDQALRL